MKKGILSVLLAVAICLSGCANVESEENSKTSMFVCVERADTWQVVYHKETKVMYVVSNGSYNYGTFTLLVDAGGNPMIWEK